MGSCGRLKTGGRGSSFARGFEYGNFLRRHPQNDARFGKFFCLVSSFGAQPVNCAQIGNREPNGFARALKME